MPSRSQAEPLALLGVLVVAACSSGGPARVTSAAVVGSNGAEPRAHPDARSEAAPNEPGSVPLDAGSDSTAHRPRPGEADCHDSATPPPPAAIRQAGAGAPNAGWIAPRFLMRPVAERAACLHACYVDGLSRRPSLHGRVAVRFVVDPDGWVRDARLDSEDTGDPVFVACVVRQFIGLHYTELEGERASVVYPILFSPE